MKKINFEIKSIYFDDKFSNVFYNNAEIEISVNNKYIILVNNIKCLGVDEDTFAQILMDEYGLDEDTAYDTMWDDEYADFYQTVSQEYAIDMIYEELTEQWVKNVMNTLADKDILDSYAA